MERHTCLMIFIFIIYDGFFIMCGGYIIIRGAIFSQGIFPLYAVLFLLCAAVYSLYAVLFSLYYIHT